MLKKIRFCIFLLLVGIQFLPAQEYYPNHLLVSLKSNASAWPTGSIAKIQSKVSGELNRLFEDYHVVRVERWLKSADANDVFNGTDFSKIYRLYLQKSALLNKAQKAFSQESNVRLAEKEPMIRIAAPIPPTVPDDPYFDRQWYLKRIMANYAWSLADKIPQDAPPVLIGIVDTGIDYLHPEIGPALYVNPGEDIDGDGQVTEADYNGVDDDGNGFVDDLLGWDFSEASDSSNGDNDIRPPVAGSGEILSHGTHVAGIAGAIPNNEIGISGIARHYKIIGTKQSRDDDYKHGYLYNAYDGVLYAAKMGADVINCSWGGSGFSQEAQDLIDMVTQKYGAIVVAAAGNDNNNNDIKHFYPSDLDNVITVAALDPADHKASFSNYGHVIDISAPGQSIFSTIHYYKGGYASWAGTSMASPVVAGSFALLKAFYPQFSRDSLISRLLGAADPLNNKLLGSGRVNVYKAVAPDYLPGLKFSGDSLVVDDLNANGQIDPGETIYLSLSIQNRPGWQDAHQVKIVARCSDSLVTVLDSVANLGAVPAGSQKATALKAFKIKISPEHAYGQFTIDFDMTCDPDSTFRFNERYSLPVLLSTYQAGFPWKANGSLLPVSTFHSAKYDANFLVFISQDYGLYLMDARGQVARGFPLDLQEFHRVPPVIIDLNGDGENEILTVSQKGKVRAVTIDGSLLWQTDLKQTVYGNVAAGDVDGDGYPEIVLATMQKQMHILTHTGIERDGFPMDIGSFVDKGVALADVNHDSLPEIIYGTFDRKLHCVNADGQELSGWPVTLPVRVHFTPEVGEDAQGVHIFVADHTGGIHVFSADGHVQLDTTLSVQISTQPALGDIDGNGLVDWIAPFNDGKVRMLAVNGNMRVLPSGNIKSPLDLAPVLLHSAAKRRIVLAASKGMVLALNENEQALSFAPLFLTQTLAASPVVCDLDNDGDLEFVSANSQAVIALDLPDSVRALGGWTTFMGNNRRTGYFKAGPATQIEKRGQITIPEQFNVTIAPNPFNSTASIKVRLPNGAQGKRLRVFLYNINGQMVKKLYEGPVRSKNYRWLWHGRNNNGQVVSSGLYFVTIQLDGHLFGRQILFVK